MYLYSIFPFLSIIGLSLLLSYKTNIKFNYILPSVLSIVIISQYIFTHLGLGKFSTIAIYFLGVFYFFAYLIRSNLFRQDLKSNITEIILIILFCLSYGFYSYGLHLNYIDDIKYLAIFSKELLYTGSFEFSNDATSVFYNSSYPRGGAIFHYFFLYPGGYSEIGVLFSHFILYTAFLLPFFRNNRLWKTIFVFVLLIFVLALTSSSLRSIDNAGLSALICATALSIYILEDRSLLAVKLIIPIISLLPIISSFGIIYSIMIIIIVGYDRLKNKENNIKNFYVILLLFSAPFLVYYGYLCSQNAQSEIALMINSSKISFNMMSFSELFKLIFSSAELVALMFFAVGYFYIKSTEKFSEYINFLIPISILHLAIFLINTTNILHFNDYYNYIYALYIIYPVVTIIYLNQELQDYSLSNKEMLVTLFIFIFSSVKITDYIDDITKFQSANDKIYDYQIEKIEQYLSNNSKVEFDFNNKSDNEDCYMLNYRLSPNFTKDNMKRCLASENQYKNFYVGKFNLNPNVIDENCIAIFRPFLLDLDVICKKLGIMN